jgi:hypothetical protein
MGDWRRSHLKNYLVQGIPQMERTIRYMLDEDLSKAILATLREIGTPTRDALIQHYNNAPAKHDGESTKTALQHRWWNPNTKRGKPVGFSRIRTLKALLQSGFGFKVKRSKDKNAFVLRVKAWGEAVHLMERGRKRMQQVKRRTGNTYQTSNQYRGWMRGINILKAFSQSANQMLMSRLPPMIEKSAASAARRANAGLIT